MAYYIFGISRLLFNWLLIFFFKSIELFNKYKFFFREKYPETQSKKLKLLEYFFMNDYEFIMIDEILKHQTDYFHR
jgi:hypothetical protein